MKTKLVAVIGGRRVTKKLLREAEEVGRLLAREGFIVLSGGLGGVMEAASKGAYEEGGTTVGILPQDSSDAANEYVDIPIATGLGIARNVIIARSADALIAVGGQYGTLSEIAFALQMKKPVVGIKSWDIDGMLAAPDAPAAVQKVVELLHAL